MYFSAERRSWSRVATWTENLSRTAGGTRGCPCSLGLGAGDSRIRPAGRIEDDAVVAQPVLRAGPGQAKRLPVLHGSIPLVVFESVGGISPGELVEQAVAVDLCDDGSGRDRAAQGITMHDR